MKIAAAASPQIAGWLTFVNSRHSETPPPLVKITPSTLVKGENYLSTQPLWKGGLKELNYHYKHCLLHLVTVINISSVIGPFMGTCDRKRHD